jgi:hypothetical protein
VCCTWAAFSEALNGVYFITRLVDLALDKIGHVGICTNWTACDTHSISSEGKGRGEKEFNFVGGVRCTCGKEKA